MLNRLSRGIKNTFRQLSTLCITTNNNTASSQKLKQYKPCSSNINTQGNELKQLQATTGSMAHEFCQTLTGAQLTVAQLNSFLTQLTINRGHFKKQHPNINADTLVSDEQIAKEKALLEKLSHVIQQNSRLLTLQLKNIQAEQISSTYFTYHSLQECLTDALHSFPFKKSTQQELIHINISDDFSFWGEPTLLTHVIWNLLQNSFYFIDTEERGEIFISQSQTQDHVLLHIKDTAKGMSKEEATLVFQPFFTRRHNGTGLGLYFCDRVMRAFHGFITCQAEPKHSVEFTLGFPKKLTGPNEK